MGDRAPSHANVRSRAIGTAGIRRALFTAPMARRPTSSSTASTVSAESRNNVSIGAGDDRHVRAGSVVSTCNGASQKGFGNVLDLSPPRELVVRDKNGELFLPEYLLDDEDDIELQEKRDQEKEIQKLREAVKHYQITRSVGAAQPDEELLSEIRSALRARVAALEDDEWMYGPTKIIAPQI